MDVCVGCGCGALGGVMSVISMYNKINNFFHNLFHIKKNRDLYIHVISNIY